MCCVCAWLVGDFGKQRNARNRGEGREANEGVALARTSLSLSPRVCVCERERRVEDRQVGERAREISVVLHCRKAVGLLAATNYWNGDLHRPSQDWIFFFPHSSHHRLVPPFLFLFCSLQSNHLPPCLYILINSKTKQNKKKNPRRHYLALVFFVLLVAAIYSSSPSSHPPKTHRACLFILARAGRKRRGDRRGRGSTRATRLIDQSRPAWWLVPRRGDERRGTEAATALLLVVVSRDERTSKRPSFPFC